MCQGVMRNSCQKLGYDLTNDFVVFPRRLKQAHDTAFKRVETLKAKERAKMLDNLSKELGGYFTRIQSDYGFADKEYAVIAPKNLNEIVKEGHALRHCVGAYAEDVGENGRTFLFLRLQSDATKPFYTMEVHGGRVTQCRGKSNCDMTDDVKQFVDLFEKRVLSAKSLPLRAG